MNWRNHDSIYERYQHSQISDNLQLNLFGTLSCQPLFRHCFLPSVLLEMKTRTRLNRVTSSGCQLMILTECICCNLHRYRSNDYPVYKCKLTRLHVIITYCKTDYRNACYICVDSAISNWCMYDFDRLVYVKHLTVSSGCYSGSVCLHVAALGLECRHNLKKFDKMGSSVRLVSLRACLISEYNTSIVLDIVTGRYVEMLLCDLITYLYEWV